MLRFVAELLPALFRLIALFTFACVPLYAWRRRGSRYAIFATVVLTLSLSGALVAHARLMTLFPAPVLPWLNAAFAYSMAAAGLHLAHLVRARLRSWPFRLGISIPGQTFIAAGFLCGGWLLLLLPLRLPLWLLGLDSTLEVMRWLDLLPFVVAVASIVTSTRPALEWVRVRVGVEGPDQVSRIPVERHHLREPAPLESAPLRIAQITDPHLGPWRSVASLRRAVQELVDCDPHLVLLTGDYLTMESSATPGALAQAFEPLKARAGRCFAVLGNHDHEARDEVRGGLEANGIRLLVDEEALVETEIGRVQILGADWVRRERREHLQTLLARYPRRDDCLRLLLLHDPSAFRHVPMGDVDLTLSGHTHGGQVGLVSFGLDWTVLSRSRWPDHGLFAHGSNRLYVHRGTGFYGFPLRVGVPGEASILELVL
jgi:predicted MPP superfamily phosphohydrolase